MEKTLLTDMHNQNYVDISHLKPHLLFLTTLSNIFQKQEEA